MINPTKELENNQNQLVKQYDQLIEVANKIALNVEGTFLFYCLIIHSIFYNNYKVLFSRVFLSF